MFGVALRTHREFLSSGFNSTGSSTSTANGSTSSMSDEDEMDEETYKKKARLCSIRKRSVEIPLENLLSGVIYLSGGRDVRDGPVLSIIQSQEVDVDLLMEVTIPELLDMLAYFTFVPSEAVRSRKFSVVVTADVMHDFFLRKIIKALNEFEQSNHLIHTVYILSLSRDPTTNYLEWAYNINTKENKDSTPKGEEVTLSLPIIASKTPDDLYQYIKPDQLTAEFSGTFQYDHQDWVRFRMQVEPFICDVVGVSKRLVEAITPFTEEEHPDTIQAAEESLKAHRYQRRKTFDTLHVEELASEGEKIKERLHSTSKDHLRTNPDFNATLHTIEVLLNRVENVRTRLDGLWKTKSEKLETKIREKKFEKEANQIIEWFEQYAEEFFETHTDLGDSLDVAQALVNELMEFEENTKEILEHTDKLLKQASKLEGNRYVGGPVKDLATKIREHLIEHNLKMESRKKKLNNGVKLHNVMEKAINWCIEGVEFLGNYDIMTGDLDDIDPSLVKLRLNEFQLQVPPPSKEEIKMLADAVSSIESHWGKESFQFALNRIVELHDRFELYHKLLDDMIAQKDNIPESPSSINTRDSTSTVHSSDGGGGRHSDSDSPDTFSNSPIFMRRTSVNGKEVQISVLDMDKTAQQAITLLESTDTQTKCLPMSPERLSKKDSCTGPDCLTFSDFLSELEQPNSKTTSLLSAPEMRSRSYSAPEDMTDSGEIKRSRSFNRKSRQTIAYHPTPSKHLDISMPSNPQFDDQPEQVSLDDITVEENPEDMAAQTATARHRRKLMEELITTEEAYIKDLEYVCQHYMPAMEDIENIPVALVGKKNVIFGLLPTFLEFSREVVLPRIRKCLRAPIKMGLVFLDHEDDFLHYAMYVKNKPQQDNLITSEHLFFKGIQDRIKGQIGLFGYLIKPVQRITKYKQFLEQMVKYSSKGKDQQDIQKGSKKEYFDKLKEALKMADFVLRHGNDLLALESLKGYEGGLAEMGRILRVGNLMIIDGFTKHHRKVFLFENCILFAKTKKMAKSGPTGSDIYVFKQLCRTSELVLRENIPGHEARFALEFASKKNTTELQAESAEEKQEWVQEIWDLFFAHMLKLRDDNLQNHGTRGLSTPMISGKNASVTRGRTLSHSMRKAKRLNTVTNRMSDSGMIRDPSQDSISSIGSYSSTTSMRELTSYIRSSRDSRTFGASPIMGSGPISPRSSLAVTFQEKYTKRMSSLSGYSTDVSNSSNRDSIVSTTSTISNSTIGEERGSSPETQAAAAVDPAATLKKSEIGILKSLNSESMDLDESFKMFNTPV